MKLGMEAQKKLYRIRLCPDCKIREVEKNCIYCSECAEARRYIAQVIYRHNWKTKNPEKYKDCYHRQNQKRKFKEVAK